MIGLIDIVCGVIIVLFAIYGVCKGFAKQIAKLSGVIVALVGGYCLFKVVFDLLYSLEFFKGIVDSLANAFGSLKFLDSYASGFGKTTGALLSEYVMMLAVFIVVAIVIGIVWKLLRGISFPICDLKFINFFDRIFGLALGVVWGALLCFGILYVWFIVKDLSFVSANVPAIGEFYAKVVEGESFVKTYIINNFGVIEKFFADIWVFILQGVKAV